RDGRIVSCVGYLEGAPGRLELAGRGDDPAAGGQQVAAGRRQVEQPCLDAWELADVIRLPLERQLPPVRGPGQAPRISGPRPEDAGGRPYSRRPGAQRDHLKI